MSHIETLKEMLSNCINQPNLKEERAALTAAIADMEKLHTAEAACAEMRALWNELNISACPGGNTISRKCYAGSEWFNRLHNLMLKTTLGTGWKSPEEWEKMQADRNAIFLHLGGIQSAIAEELESDTRTPITEDECRLAVRKVVQQLAEARKDSERRQAIIARIVFELPVNRDWLDPELESRCRVELKAIDAAQKGDAQ